MELEIFILHTINISRATKDRVEIAMSAEVLKPSSSLT